MCIIMSYIMTFRALPFFVLHSVLTWPQYHERTSKKKKKNHIAGLDDTALPHVKIFKITKIFVIIHCLWLGQNELCKTSHEQCIITSNCLPKYCVKKSSIPQYRKPKCPPHVRRDIFFFCPLFNQTLNVQMWSTS